MTVLPIALLPAASADLDAIETYILEITQWPRTARDYVERILARCEALGHAPMSGVDRGDIAPGVRSIVVERRAIVLYRPRADRIDILRVFGRGRDYDTLLAKNPGFV